MLLGHLDSGQPDTTTGGMDEHLVAGIQLRPVERKPNRERRGGIVAACTALTPSGIGATNWAGTANRLAKAPCMEP